jgi:allophanate hydrolase
MILTRALPKTGDGAAPWSSSGRFSLWYPQRQGLWSSTAIPTIPLSISLSAAKLIALGGEPVEFDLAPFLATAQLLYKGPWVAERYAAIAPFIKEHADKMDPSVAAIISGAKNYSAVDTFNAAYKLEALSRQTKNVWNSFDVMLLPTAPRAYTIEEIAEAPIERNSHLGHYTNFVNLLDLSAIAVPAGMRPDGLPFGVSLIGQAFQEVSLLSLADRLHRGLGLQLWVARRESWPRRPLYPLNFRRRDVS